MNHKHRNTLHALFAHPVSSNIEARLAYALIEELGGEVAHSGHGHIKIKLNGHTRGFHDAQHSLAKEEVVELRKFLEAAVVDPTRDFPLEAGAA